MSEHDVTRALERHWGLRAQVVSLGSLQDSVYRVLDEQDQPVGAVRESSGAVDLAEVDGEARLLAHLSEALPDLDLPVLQPALDGTYVHRDGDTSIRLMRWVRGVPLSSWSRLPDQAATELGAVAGRFTAALRDFDDAALHRHQEWDPRHAVSVCEDYLDRCPEELREPVEQAIARTRAAFDRPAAALLPWQVVHMDLTDLNVLGSFAPDGTVTVTSVVDFEDMAWSWRLCELAVTAHAAIGRRTEDPLRALAHTLDGFLRHASLDEAEADLLWDVLVARAVVCALIEAVETAEQPDNAYARRVAAVDAAALQAVLDVDAGLARAHVRRACGLPPVGATEALDLPDDRAVVPLVEAADEAGYQVALDLADEERDRVVPAGMSLGTVVRTAGPSVVSAPVDCEVVEASRDSLTLRLGARASRTHLRVGGVHSEVVAGSVLSAGDRLGTVEAGDAGSHELHVQLVGDLATPSAGNVREAALWRALCPDPHVFLPSPAQMLPSAAAAEDAVERRRAHVAPVQKTYYRRPPHIVSGRRQWLHDSTGRRYLDMVNNVAVVGHSHPRITEAATTQLGLLSTNSRFLYDAIADYAEKIVATLPPELDTVLFVNSGSEAVELALQLARAHTGRHDVVVTDGAYHGWTTELVEVITTDIDRPAWRDKLAPWVHVAAGADTYRGAHGDDVDAYVASLEEQCQAATAHGGAAAFLHEPVLGSRGGVVPPAGYLARAYEVVRRAGGVCIADEVQVGMARTGASFWSFEGLGAVPDIVASAKAAGNGHPVGFVACRREIAESFAGESVFFSTAGGNPVSCRVGEAVLDIIRDEELQENARRVGDRIKAGLAVLQERHETIGTTYGLGLYQGVDLIEGPAQERTPLRDERIADICERLLELGLVVQPTGPLGNVLKIKPPLCLDEQDADRFLAALDQTLTEHEELMQLVATIHTEEV